jgi:hypothetical protein
MDTRKKLLSLTLSSLTFQRDYLCPQDAPFGERKSKSLFTVEFLSARSTWILASLFSPKEKTAKTTGWRPAGVGHVLLSSGPWERLQPAPWGRDWKQAKWKPVWDKLFPAGQKMVEVGAKETSSGICKIRFYFTKFFLIDE